MTHEIPGADVITRFSALPARVLRENSAMGGFTLSQYFVYYWMTKAQQLFFLFKYRKKLAFFPIKFTLHTYLRIHVSRPNRWDER